MINKGKFLVKLRKMMVLDKGGKLCRTMILCHIDAAGRKEPVEPFAIRQGSSEKILITEEDLVSKIEESAQSEADTYGGVQKFAVVPYYGEGNTLPGGKASFSLYGNDDDEDEDMGNLQNPREDTTPRGQEAQRMRHNENYYRQSMAVTTDAHKLLRAENVSLREQNSSLHDKLMAKDEQYATKRLEMIELTEKLYTQAARRNIEQAENEMKTKAMQALVDKLGILLPHVVNHAVGAKVIPTNSNPEWETIKGVVETIKPEQLGMLAQVLDETQMLAMSKLIEKVIDEKDAATAQESAKKLANVAPAVKQLPQ